MAAYRSLATASSRIRVAHVSAHNPFGTSVWKRNNVLDMVVV